MSGLYLPVAFALGYLASWFVWGIPLPALLTLWLGGMAVWAWAEGSRRGLADFAVLVTVLLGFVFLSGSLTVLAILLRPGSGYEFTGIILPFAALALLGSLILLTLLLVWLRRSGRTLQTPLTPWLWLAGCVAFTLLPVVRVDCRGLQSDDFLSFQSDFQSHARMPRWVKYPEQLPARAELPAGFKVEQVRAGVVGCQRAPFSFAVVRPLLVVHLTEKVQPGMKAYAAAFTPGTHCKLTPWVQVQEMPFSLRLRQRRSPYGGLGWDVYPSYPATPPEIAALLVK